MKHDLVFEFNLTPHPYLHDYNSFFEAWGRMHLTVRRNAEIVCSLINIQWDIIPFAEWFVANKEALATEELIVEDTSDNTIHFPTNYESLAHAMQRFLYFEFPSKHLQAEDLWFDKLYEYRTRHNLRFGIEGVDILDVVLGLNGGIGEVSCMIGSDLDDYDWSYNFDMEKFLGQVRVRLMTVLKEWIDQTSDPLYRKRAEDVLAELVQL